MAAKNQLKLVVNKTHQDVEQERIDRLPLKIECERCGYKFVIRLKQVSQKICCPKCST